MSTIQCVSRFTRQILPWVHNMALMLMIMMCMIRQAKPWPITTLIATKFASMRTKKDLTVMSYTPPNIVFSTVTTLSMHMAAQLWHPDTFNASTTNTKVWDAYSASCQSQVSSNNIASTALASRWLAVVAAVSLCCEVTADEVKLALAAR